VTTGFRLPPQITQHDFAAGVAGARATHERVETALRPLWHQTIQENRPVKGGLLRLKRKRHLIYSGYAVLSANCRGACREHPLYVKYC